MRDIHNDGISYSPTHFASPVNAKSGLQHSDSEALETGVDKININSSNQRHYTEKEVHHLLKALFEKDGYI